MRNKPSRIITAPASSRAGDLMSKRKWALCSLLPPVLALSACGRSEPSNECQSTPQSASAEITVGDVRLPLSNSSMQLRPMKNCSDGWYIDLLHFDDNNNPSRKLIFLQNPGRLTTIQLSSVNNINMNSIGAHENIVLRGGRNAMMTCTAMPDPQSTGQFGACRYLVRYTPRTAILAVKNIKSVARADWISAIESIIEAVDQNRLPLKSDAAPAEAL